MLRATPFALPFLIALTAVPIFAAGVTDMPLVFSDDFENGDDHWKPSDPAAWKVKPTDRGNVYNQFQLSKYKPPHRSPHNISLVKDVPVDDFVLTVDVQSTNVDAGAHRDMCIFFNYQDPAHFYYVHMGVRPDPHSSQIMIVNDAPRKMITKNESPGIPWTKGWHKIKVARNVADGKIKIYFDDMKKPVMVAEDKTFIWGQVGIGSFDDHGNWDNFQLYGQKVERPKKP
jgi:hypothetical protein